MIKKPWQIWSLFGLILLVVLPAMVWLTMQINHADRLREEDRAETELARRKAELQERINSALYRLDSWTTPLVAQEVARPYYLYQPFIDVVGYNSLVRAPVLPTPQLPNAAPQLPNSSDEQEASQQQQTLRPVPQTRQSFGGNNLDTQRPSPLLFGTSEYVIMHFQITSDNQVTSPQRPSGEGQSVAIAMCNIPEDQLRDNEIKLNLAEQFCKYEDLAFQCPTLPPANLEPENNSPAPQLLAANGPAPFHTTYRDSSFATGSSFTNGWAPPNIAEQLSSVKQFPKLPSLVKGGKGGKGSSGYGKGSKSEQQTDRNIDRGNREYNSRAEAAANTVDQQYRIQQGYNYSVLNDATNGPNDPFGAFPPQNNSNNFELQIASNAVLKSNLVREGMMRPIWLDDRLLLARRVEGEDKKLVQCCWLDWEKIEAVLKKEIADLLPECELQPVKDQKDLNLTRAMATLPVQLVVNSDKLLSTLALNSNPQISASPSALKLSMTVAWIGLGMAALASALLLRGVLKLSERRAAFVSAVTHELRTPLTTFRMYSEMLAEEMVPEEKRGEYAETMKHEADRLSNLVENVLQFAKLERGAGEGRNETINVLDLLGRFEDRLEHRASTMGMDFSIDLGETASALVSTDPGKVELIVFNLVDNACKYASHGDNNRIELTVQQTAGTIAISVRDYGPGVAAKFRKLLFKPFCKSDQDAADTASGVGLGLALCQQMAKSISGRVSFVPCDQGAKFALTLPVSNQQHDQ